MARAHRLGGLTVEGTDGQLAPRHRARPGEYVQTPEGRGILRAITGPADGWQRWRVMVRGKVRIYDVQGWTVPERGR